MAKSIYSAFLITTMLVAFVPTLGISAKTAAARLIPANGKITTRGLYNITGYSGPQPVVIEMNGITLTGKHENLSVVINQNATLTLQGAHIKCTAEDTAPIRAGGLDCKLILVDSNSLEAEGHHAAGINVPPGTSLIIEGSGSLYAAGSDSIDAL